MLNKFFLCFLIIISCYTSVYAQKIQYILIDKAHRRIPVAVPEFKISNGHAKESIAAEKAKRILIDSLDFTGYLGVMDSIAYLADPSKTGISFSDITFKDWTDIGAEFLITAGIEEDEGGIKMELRCFDTFNTNMVVGKLYSGSDSQIRKIIHLFCSEIFYVLTGKRGIFDTAITFVSTVNEGKEIFTCDFDGQNINQITFHDSLSLSPALSPDGKWLAYVSYAEGKPDLYIKNLLTNQGVIVNKTGINISPAWRPDQMPDRSELAASLSFSGDAEIYLLSVKGEVIKKLTNSLNIDVSPSFSPDGKKIAFTSRRSGRPQIYIKDIESGSVRRLTFTGTNNTSPAWSPDGNKIAYVGLGEGRMNIYIMDINTGNPIQLTSKSGDNEDPSWSPDGSMLAFTSTREQGVSKIFIMNASGSNQRRLVSLNGKQSQPYWAKQ